MKNFLPLLIVLLCTYSALAQINNERQNYTEFDILNYYYQTYESAESIDSAMYTNSRALRVGNPRLYFIHEMARALFYKSFQHYEEAIEITYSLKEHSFTKESIRAQAALNTITGILLDDLKKYEEARDHFNEAISYQHQLNDSTGLKGNIINIGKTYFNAQAFDSALFYFIEAKRLEQEGFKGFEKILQNNIATVFQNQNKLNESLAIYMSLLSSDIPLVKHNSNSNVTTHFNIGEVYKRLANYELAIVHYKEALNTTRKFNSVVPSEIYKSLSEVEYKVGNFKAAYQHALLSDSLQNIENEKGALEKLNFFKIEKQKKLRIQQAKSDKIIIDTQNRINRFYLSSLTILLILFSIIVYLYTLKRKKNRLLAEKNIALTKAQINLTQPKANKPKPTKLKPISIDLIENFEELLFSKKVFTQKDINLEKLAKKLNTNRSYLSEAINQHYQVSFTQILNKYRIKEAREMLIDEKFDHYSIEGVAQSVGYRNISTFNAVFKKETGITPSFFRKSNKT